MSIQGRRVTHTLRVLKPRQRELMTQENWSIIFIMRSVHIYRAIYICFFQSYMISLRISRQFKTNHVTNKIHLLKHFNYILSWLAFILSSFHQHSSYFNYFQSVLFKCKNYSRKVCHKEVQRSF